VGGLPDLVADGETGCLVPPGDAPALAAAVARLLRHTDLRLALGGAARTSVAERFAVDRLVRDVEGLYDELLVKRGVIASDNAASDSALGIGTRS
jgi:glycosyltransferase involved in cell wall biosynthesis